MNPDAPSDYHVTQFTPTQYAVLNEIRNALISLGATSGLMATVNSWGDTLSDEDVLSQLKEWNGLFQKP